MFPPSSAAPAAQAAQTRPRRKVGAEWVPAAHGAWAMLLLPYLMGIMLRLAEGPLPAYIWPLLPTWLLGYFAYNALTLWLKSGGKPRYLRPLAVYTGAAAVFGGLTLWLRPELLNWALVFTPLLGVGLWRASQRDDASLLARGSAVAAACLVSAVVAAGSLEQTLTLGLTHPVILATLALWGYFGGMLLYVKTMIRERGSARYQAWSLGFHLLVLAAASWTATQGTLGWNLPVFFGLAAFRAALMPQLERLRGKRTTPRQVGLLEFALSVLLLWVLPGATAG